MAAVLLVGVFYAPDEFNEVVVMKKFHLAARHRVRAGCRAAVHHGVQPEPRRLGERDVAGGGNWAVAFWLFCSSS